MSIKESLKIIVEKINFKNINFNIINKNIQKLVKIHNLLQFIWNQFDNIIFHVINIDIGSKEYTDIMNKLKKSMFSQYKKFKELINQEPKYLKKISYSNINFYYIFDSEEQFKRDIEYIIYLFKISLCLRLFKIQNDVIIREIIWYPIFAERNFGFNEINDRNLEECVNNFEAFTASGVTYGNNPRITIVTRYEEAMKLLIHELIHNYYIDGSCYHDELQDIISKYKNIKNLQNYDYEYSIYESYTELVASYLTLLFLNIDLTGETLKEKLLSQIILELLYSYNTIANLAILSNIGNLDDEIIFKGDICIYEYYYIKGLMYNNFELIFGHKLDEFKKIYQNIIKMINNINADKLLKNIFVVYVKQNNFKYMLH